MKHACFIVVLVLASAIGSLQAAPPPLLTASGIVVKANANVLIVRPRLADGRFDNALTLKLRGTSTATVLRTRGGSGMPTLVQQSTSIKDLQPNQTIAVIYTNTGDEYVLLSAVARP
jgi:hypothetical protein